MKTSASSENKPSKSGIGEALMSLARNSVTPLKSSPSPSSRHVSPLHSPCPVSATRPLLVTIDDNTPPDISDQPIITEHVTTTSDQNSSATDQSVAQSLELLFKKFALLADTPKPKSAVKARTPETIDESNPQKLDN